MGTYKVLNKQVYTKGDFSLVPIRFEDRYDIMKWRNEQIYHLRQNKPLTKEDQDAYFENIVSKLFDQDQPNQILFSFLEGEKCIGYGGLVHINWLDKNAEISFVMNTSLEDQFFIKYWEIYLNLLKSIAFKELDLHKIYTYAFDLRPKLYVSLENSGFVNENRLVEHSLFNGKYYDVLYHGCINPIHYLDIREANKNDAKLLFDWANEVEVRANAFNSKTIEWESHQEWFSNKINDKDCFIYIFSNKLGVPIGQVRIEKKETEWIIDYSVDKSFRGLGLGALLIKTIIGKHRGKSFKAFVKANNTPSLMVFQKLGFKKLSKDDVISFVLNL